MWNSFLCTSLSLELTLGLPHFKDAVTKVEAGVEFEANDLADIANHPNMTFYFGFKSPVPNSENSASLNFWGIGCAVTSDLDFVSENTTSDWWQ